MNKAQGFTLVELIIVIVVLGILAVTAAPQFINLSGDARGGTVNGMKASIQSAMTLINARAKANGDENATEADTSTTELDGATIHYGYPNAESIGAVLDYNASDWTIQYFDGDLSTTVGGENAAAPAAEAANITVLYPAGQLNPDTTEDSGTCYVQYTEATSSTEPVVTVVTSGC